MTDQNENKHTYILFIVGAILTLIGSGIAIVYDIKSDISMMQGKYDSLDVLKFKNSMDAATDQVQQKQIELSNLIKKIETRIEKLNTEKNNLTSSYKILEDEMDKITSFSKYIYDNSSKVQIVELPIDMVSYTNELSKLGLMSEIYGTTNLSIMVKDNNRAIRSSQSTENSIHLDINNITKSSINKVGGQVSHVPYNPEFIMNLANTGYSDFSNIGKPDIIVSGFSENETLTGTKNNIIYSINVDFSLLDFHSMIAIKKMTVNNKLKTHNSFSEGFLGITVYSDIFKNKGIVKKALSVNDASRSLVELSIIQLIGRNLLIPYWKLFGENAIQDNIVIEILEEKYFSMQKEKQIKLAQQFLFIHSYDVTINGILDKKTRLALNELEIYLNPASDTLSFKDFLTIYSTVPINVKTLVRRKAMKNGFTRPF